MKFYYIDDKSCKVFVNNIIANINLKNKEELEKFLKKIVKCIDNKFNYSIFGLFEVDIFVNEKVGMFIKFEKINSIISYRDIDLKVNIIYNCDFYFKTDFYECLENNINVFYKDDFYYTNIDNIIDITKYIEYGEIIYDNKLNIERDFLRIK